MKLQTLYDTVIGYQNENRVHFQNAENWDVRRFNEMFHEKELVLQDWFQRDYCWSKQQVAALIHTLLHTPTLLPEIVLIEIDNKFYVADGHQRLKSLIVQVFNNPDFKYTSKELSENTKYHNASPKNERVWKNFVRELERKTISVKVIRNVNLEENELRNLKSYVFKKWNNGKALNSAEKRGSFPSDLNIQIIQNLKEQIKEEKQQALLVSNTVGRNAFNEFIEKMFYHFYEKDAMKDPNEDGYEKIHDLDFTLINGLVSRFSQMFNVMTETVYSFTEKNGKFSVGSCCMRDLLTFVNSLYAKKEIKNLQDYRDYLLATLDTFHSIYLTNDKFKDYSQNNLESIDPEINDFWYKGFFVFYGKGQDGKFIHRREFLNKNKNLFGYLGELDDKRLFSVSQKQLKYIQQGKKCLGLENSSCPHTEGEISINDMNGDHIKEYSLGGTTTLDNLQMLCHECHKEKTKKFMREKVLVD